MSKKKENGNLTIHPVESNDEGIDKDEPTNPYRVTWFDRIPFWVKAVFIKYWVCGVVYFFVDFGLGEYIMPGDFAASDNGVVLLILIDGVIYGLASFLLGNFLMGMCEHRKNEARPYSVIYSKKVWALWAMMVYGILYAYSAHMLSGWFVTLINNPESWLFREPLSFALVGLPVEMAFVGLKDLLVFIYKKITHKETV